METRKEQIECGGPAVVAQGAGRIPWASGDGSLWEEGKRSEEEEDGHMLELPEP
jgi:hypothetical protein